ncbi:MAG: aldose 1-epimerase family protein [Gemmataceae bacterium]|nr:aldose 1-epimerase family protein [Gemmataceae bacterium]
MRFWLSFLFVSISSAGVCAQEFRKTVTSLHGGRADWVLSPKETKTIAPDCPVSFSIRKEALSGGRQEGSELLILDNGKLQITLVPTRGLGILDVKLGEMRLGWDSPVKEVVHPKFMNLQARGGLGWLDGFNEWLVRCGLENNGQAGPDRFINNMGDEATMELTLHGKIANLPAQEVEIVVDPKPPHRITIRGIIHERMFFGPKLELRTELSTVPGSTSFQIKDVVTNRGAQPEEFQMLYHINFGKPLLEEGARFVAPVKRVTPFSDRAAKDVKNYDRFLGPTLGYIEQVYLFQPLANKEGGTTILLHNKAADKGTSLTYSLKELPYLTLWKNTAAEADGYVCGLEPGTNYPNHRKVERKFGRVPKLAGGASHTMSIEVQVHVSAEEVAQASRRIEAIQGRVQPVLDEARKE